VSSHPSHCFWIDSSQGCSPADVDSNLQVPSMCTVFTLASWAKCWWQSVYFFHAYGTIPLTLCNICIVSSRLSAISVANSANTHQGGDENSYPLYTHKCHMSVAWFLVGIDRFNVPHTLFLDSVLQYPTRKAVSLWSQFFITSNVFEHKVLSSLIRLSDNGFMKKTEICSTLDIRSTCKRVAIGTLSFCLSLCATQRSVPS
jgi:hypothetical protein